MSRYEKLLHMLMDYDATIMFTAIGDTSGNILWNTIRDDSKVQIPLPEIKKTLVRESKDWISRCKIEDSDDLGRALYHIASFEKIKQVTIPLDAFYLFCVFDVLCHPFHHTFATPYFILDHRAYAFRVAGILTLTAGG